MPDNDTKIQGTQIGDGNIQYNQSGVPIEKYESVLKEKESEYRQLLVDKTKSDVEKDIIQKQLNTVETKLADVRSSYQSHIQELEKRIERLDRLKGKIPEHFIQQAKQALKEGNNEEANRLFTLVEEQADPHIMAAAEAAYQRGKLAEDDISYQEALMHYQRAIQLIPDNPEYLEYAASMAGVLGKFNEQLKWNEGSLAIYKKCEDSESDIARLHNNLGGAWDNLGEYRKAIDYYELALNSDLKTYGEDHPYVAIRRNNLGLAWKALGQYQKAIDYLELALNSDLKSHGEVHPDVSIRRNNLGLAWKALGQYQKAINYYELALVNELKIYGEDHPKLAICRNNLGAAWGSLGEYQKAIDYYELALASNLKTYGDDHPNVATERNNLGTAWGSLGQYQKAIDYLELALASDLKSYGEDHPDVARDRSNLGLAWGSLGQYQKAIDYLELALASSLKTFGEDHPIVVFRRNNLGMAWHALGENHKP